MDLIFISYSRFENQYPPFVAESSSGGISHCSVVGLHP